MVTLLSEDLLLLLLDDDSGVLKGTSYPQAALGGAVLMELALSEAVTVAEKSSVWSSSKVTVTSSVPADPVLRAAYDVVAEKPRSAQDLVTRLGKGLQDTLAERLVQRGILERRDQKILGLFPRKTWPTVDAGHEQEVRRALTASLVQGLDPDPRTGALIAMLSAIDRAHKVVDHDGMSARDVRKRAKEISEGAWAAKAVRDSIAAATAAITTAVVATTVVTTTGSS